MRVKDDSPPELFGQGIKSETLGKYTRTLQHITCKILEGTLERTPPPVALAAP